MNICYIGDIPVEATYHGSAVLFRLFQAVDLSLTIAELAQQSDASVRLKHAEYIQVKNPFERLQRTRFHKFAKPFSYRFRRILVASLLKSTSNCSAVVTIAHGMGWLVAADLAKASNKPLHLIVHDYPPEKFHCEGHTQRAVERHFLRVYGYAASRMCISPYMEAHYKTLTNVSGDVLYPGRSQIVSAHAYTPPRHRGAAPFTIGFFGTIYADSTIEVLHELCEALEANFGPEFKINIYGSQMPEIARSVIGTIPNVVNRGFIAESEFMSTISRELDALILPIPFDDTIFNLRVHFPSKLTDYTATGLPVLVHGPASSSGVKWASQFDDTFLVSQSRDTLLESVSILKDYKRCVSLGRNSYCTGAEHFDYEQIGQRFRDIISPKHALG